MQYDSGFYDIDLSGRNSFHVRQRAARLVEFETTDDLTAFFRKGAPAKWTVLAGGNNILFTQDFDGVLLTPRAASIDVVAETPDAVAVRAEAGVEWDDLVAWAVERDLWGIENLSLIPGKVGAAPVQNIGAYGAEAKDAIESVEMISFSAVPVFVPTISRALTAHGIFILMRLPVMKAR